MIFKNQDHKIKNRSKIDEADSFWNVECIVPPIKAKKPVPPTYDSTAVLISDGNSDDRPMGEALKGSGYSSEVLLEYKPDSPLISSVEICSWPSKYSFYEGFKADAERFFDVEGERAEPIKYFSYMPTYAQMDRRQRAWYFYWRHCLRKGEYLETDSSYILLYIYEIINLPDRIPPEKGLELLCDVWERYRKSYTKLDKFLAEWVCDYCLINRLRPPYERLSAFYDDVVFSSRLKQIYIRCESDDGYAELLLEKLNTHRWQTGKYITPENKPLFAEHIRRGFVSAVKAISVFDGRFDGGSGRLAEKKTIRDSFSGALCAYVSKRKINVTYFEADNRGEMGFIVTDMVRYCENRVRAYLGIKGRLTVQNLTEEHKKAIDLYFDKHLPCEYTERRYENRGGGDETYVVRVEERRPFSVSIEKAKEIESDSWRITDRLVEDMYDDADDVIAVSAQNGGDDSENTAENTPEGSTLDVAREGLICIARGDMAGFAAIAEECYMLTDTLAECVNELCYEITGDIGIEEINGGYRLISEYEQEIKQWLKL